ncbi:MAG: hypothetical protein LBN27_03655, partial [Prevotellaceae bacterium]|nr:hypothetical protein [Prevotellaceae bacterium]
MARVAGITVEKTDTGKPKKIIFSYPVWGILLQEMFIEKGFEFPIPIPSKQKAVTTTKKTNKEIAGTKPNVAAVKIPRGYLTSQEFRK